MKTHPHNQVDRSKRPKKGLKYWLSSALILGAALFLYEEWVIRTKQVTPRPASLEELRHAADDMRFPAWQAPKDLDPKMVALGQRLFFDPGFSSNQSVSCATCHSPDKSFTDGRAQAFGIAQTAMNAPTLINVFAGRWFFHNGRADSLAMQALGPTEDPREHGFSRQKVLQRLNNLYKSEYESLFGPLPKVTDDDLLTLSASPKKNLPQISDPLAAYALGTLGSSSLQKQILLQAHKEGIQPIHIVKRWAAGQLNSPPMDTKTTTEAVHQVFANFGAAIAAFEQTIRTTDSAFDQFAEAFAKQNANPEASFVNGFGPQEYEGFKIFVGEGQCTLCHNGPTLSDHQFHNIGLPAIEGKPLDLGRAQGILLAKENPFNCQGPYLKQQDPSEACLELEFAELEQTEWVGAFKTPTLRNLKDTSPYGHDGRFAKISDILLHYNTLTDKPAVGHTEESLRPLQLKDQQLKDLEAFLLSLSSEVRTGL